MMLLAPATALLSILFYHSYYARLALSRIIMSPPSLYPSFTKVERFLLQMLILITSESMPSL